MGHRGNVRQEVSQSAMLPTEQITGVNWRELISCFIAAILCVGLANATYYHALQGDRTNLGYNIIEKKFDILERLAEPVDLLVLGDSSCNQGFDPRVWTRLTGASSVNLCTVGNMTLLGDLWLLDRYIQKHGAPKQVILIHVYDVWRREIDVRLLGQLPYRWSDLMKLYFPRSLSFKDMARVATSRYLPLYSRDRTIRGQINRLIKGENASIGPTIDENGYMAEWESNARKVESDAEIHLRFLSKNEFRPSDTSNFSLKMMIELSERYEFRLYIAKSPIYDQMMKSADFRSYVGSVSQYLEASAGSAENVVFLRADWIFTGNQMQNIDHVIDSAAREFTGRLSREISR